MKVLKYILIMLFGMISSQIYANSLSPIILEMSYRKPLSSVTYTNTSTYNVTIQVGPMAWIQDKQVNRFQETSDLTIVPYIVTIPPGGTQVFRVKWNGSINLAEERAYRILFEDITPDEALPQNQQNVVFRINHNIPVFVEPANKKASVQWSECNHSKQALCIRLDNKGNVRARYASLTLAGQGWKLERPGGVTALANESTDLYFDLNGLSPDMKSLTLQGLDAVGKSFSIRLK